MSRATQLDFERIGAEGCYFLSLIYAAEEISTRKVDIYAAYLEALSHDYIDERCYIKDPGRLFAMLVGGTWEATHQPRDYVAKPGEVIILRFERREGMKVYAHFVVGAPDGSVAYDPYGVSKTVMVGQLVSKRRLRRIL
jgi:hypothetical protein